jgi:hypothetical protein
MEKYNDLIGNRTRDLPACSVVPRPTTLPLAPYFILRSLILILYPSEVSNVHIPEEYIYTLPLQEHSAMSI